MSVWEDVKSGYDSDDETINFGSRNIVEAENGSFECVTIATLASQGQMNNIPSIMAISVSEKLCIALDRSISLFDLSEKSDKTCFLNMSFNSPVECLSLTEDGKFLFLCDNEGTLYIMHIPTSQIVMSKFVCAQNSTGNKTFSEVLLHSKVKEEKEFVDVIMVTSDSHVHRIAGFDLEELEKIITTSSVEECATLIQALPLETYEVGKDVQVVSAALLSDNKLMLGGDHLVVCELVPSFEVLSKEKIQAPENYITKIQMAQHASIVYILLSNGKLWHVCPFTLLHMKILNKEQNLADFVLLENSKDGTRQLLTLSKNENLNNCQLKLTNYEDTEDVYGFELGSITHLVLMTNVFEDAIFLEGQAKDNYIDKYMLRTITKSQPEFRLQRLLRKLKFEEAEEFAIRYNLDLQVVYKEQAVEYIRQMSPWGTKSDDQYLYSSTSLIKILEKVEDFEYVVKCCINAIAPDITQTRELLVYARSIILKHGEQLLNADELKTKVCHCIQRLDTLEIISNTSSTEQWLEFYQADLLEICVNYLQNDELGRASIVWMRHETELLPSFSEDQILPMLDLVSGIKDPCILFSWLNAFIPSILTVMPSEISDIINWLHIKIKSLEFKNKGEWPQIALDYCENVLAILQPPATEGLTDWLVHLHQQHSNPDSALHHLHDTRKALHEVLFLQTRIGISLSMEIYTQEDKQALIQIILANCQVDKLDLLMKEFFTQKCQEYMLDREQMIYTFIESMVKNGCWWGWESAPWEKHVMPLIKFIKSLDWLLSCTLAILKAAPVPWSTSIVNLLENVENCNHPLATEIQSQRLFEKSKLILKKYNLCDSSKCVEFTELDFEMHVSRIFKTDTPDILQDSLQLVHTEPSLEEFVQILYIEIHLRKRLFAQAKQHLQSLPMELQHRIASKLFYKIKSAYKMGYDELEIYLDFYESIEDCLQKTAIVVEQLEKKEHEVMLKEMRDEANLIRKNYKLQKKYGIRVESANSLGHKRDVYVNYIAESLEKTAALDLISKARNVAHLLGINQSEAQLLLAANLYEEKHLPALVVVLSEFEPLVDLKTFEMQLLQDICKKLLSDAQQVASSEPAIFSSLKHALCEAASFTNNLPHLEKLQSLIAKVQIMTELAAFGFGAHSINDLMQVNTVSKDPYTNWSFTSIYQDLPVNASNCCKALQPVLNAVVQQDKFTGGDLTSKEYLMSDMTVALFPKNFEIANEGEDNEIEQLQTTVMQLKSENNYLLAYHVITDSIILNINDPYKIDSLRRMKFDCILALLKQVLSARKADLPLALALLLDLPQGDAMKWLQNAIKRVNRECNQLSRMTRLAIDFSNVTLITQHLPQLISLHKLANWGKTLQKLGISNKSLMQEKRENAFGSTLALLIQNHLHLPTIKQFCNDFELRFYEAVLYSLEYIITSWQPKISFVKKQQGLEELAPNDYQHVIATGMSLIRAIIDTHKKELIQKLNIIWEKINPYHYEMYLCVLKLKSYITSEPDAAQESILMFLNPYKRRVAPQAAEIEKWQRTHPDDSSLPALAKWRLPYPTFVTEPQRIIEAEVNLQSYSLWLQAPQALNCVPDMICVAAVKNSINANICMINLEEWCVQAQDQKVISDIEECVNYMADLPVATALLDYVNKRIPPGLDKLSVVQLCHQKLQQWKAEDENEENKELDKKISRRLLHYSAVHVLHMHSLGKKEYLHLAENPVELVEALYNDPSIIERSQGNLQHYPDIHAAVSAIVQLHNLSIEEIRFRLVEGWLLSDSFGAGSLDESFVDVSQVWHQFDEDMNKENEEADKNLIKLRFVLEAEIESHEGIDYLIGVTFTGTSSAKVRLRALTCLLWIVPEQSLAESTGRDVSSIREFAKTLYFLSELEKVNIIYSVNEYESHDKISIIESLWRGHSQNPQAVMLMCKLCLHYQVFKQQVWANLLSRMQQLNMLKELGSVLPKLNKNSHSLCTTQFISAWNYVLLSPFVKAVKPLIREQEEACVRSLAIMQGCPILKDVRCGDIFKLCLQLERYDLAALLLPLTCTKDRQQLLQVLLNTSSKDVVKNMIENMKKYCSLHITEALLIVDDYEINTSLALEATMNMNGH